MKTSIHFTLTALLGLFLLTFSTCKNDTSAGLHSSEEDGTATTTTIPAAPATDPNAAPQIPELPYSCSVLTDEIVREVFDYGEEHGLLPIHGQALGSCYYKMTTDDWTADLVFEPIDPLNKDGIDAEIARATGNNRTTLAGHPACWTNEGRILYVAAPKPYAIKLSVLPRGQHGKAVDEEQRRAWILEVAEAVDGKL